MNSNTGSGRNDARESLLNELESIRSLLKEPNEEHTPHAPNHSASNDAYIPVLNDAITESRNDVPVLNDRISPPDILRRNEPETNPDLQLASVRAAAAVIAAKAVRNRDTGSRTAALELEKRSDNEQRLDNERRKDNEQLIAAVIDELRPQLESLLRNSLRKHLTAQGNNSPGNP